jgi:uncharacterized membrane protein YdjX (TVP38/TMEM64 family)
MTPPAPSARRRAALIRLLVLALGLAAGGVLLKFLGAAPGTEWVDHYVLGQGLLGDAVFVLAGAALTAAGVPRQGIAFLAGYAFGAVEGTALALTAQILGCGVAYAWARAIGRPWAEARLAGRFGHRLRPMRDVLVGSPFGATLALRLLPIGNNLAVNLLAGIGKEDRVFETIAQLKHGFGSHHQETLETQAKCALQFQGFAYPFVWNLRFKPASRQEAQAVFPTQGFYGIF